MNLLISLMIISKYFIIVIFTKLDLVECLIEMDFATKCLSKYSRLDILAAVSFIITGVVMVGLFGASMDNQEIQKDTKRNPIAKLMLALSIIGIFASLA